MGYNHNLYISISEVSTSGFRVNGTVTLGQNSYNANGFNVYTSVDGLGTNNHTAKISSKGGSYSFSDYYSVGTSYSSRSYSCHVGGTFSWSSSKVDSGNPVNATATVPAIARPTHTVKYDANGGTGAPGNQTKTYGYILTLSSTTPTKNGYTFAGWGTSASSTDVKYAPGGQYSADADITLYAIWTLIATCTIAYNANGGTNAPVSQTHIMNTTSYISEGKPTRDKYVFCGWSTSSTATKGSYLYGSKYVNNSFSNGDTITLYAVWVKKPPMLHVATEGQKTVKAIYVNVPDGKSLKSVFFKTG